ncbi:DJ-1/PfpI family protein [Sphingomonas hengshuiensis]|uniref:Thiamine biosynthesis protein ThiJ n=1 Tax=Sphingomonas hengshuiensis TaxID=1609977 RepID=A0A7U4JBF3_9SPHN|nr:DJ-1/PfpI family protein [Sphingomonas hengshuiensis]AJP73740.1 thiamine biosynthesis protein ThiJ [Sphingomonas hengshuiensis]
MEGFDRRTALMMGLFGALAASRAGAQTAADPHAGHTMAEMPPGWVKPDQIAMLCYPGMTILDLIGPQYMFAALMGATVHLVGKTRDPMTSDTGVTILPTTTFAECPKDLTVLFAPGGASGTLAAMRDDATRAFIADRGARAQYVTSVCTGALILGAAGLLQGYRATTHWAALETLADCGATPVSERVVRDRNRITGAGVTAGLDFGIAMVAELRDPVYAQGVQLGCEYDPQPPFHAGSTRTAPPEVQAIMRSMYTAFPGQVRAALAAVKAAS